MAQKPLDLSDVTRVIKTQQKYVRVRRKQMPKTPPDPLRAIPSLSICAFPFLDPTYTFARDFFRKY